MHVAWPLIGHEGAEQAFLDAHARGQLHHGWLLEGPSGIGKSRLASRFAAYLLGARGPADAPLDTPTDDPVAQKIQAGAHPDLRWLARRPDDKGKLPQDIKVEEVRKLIDFFALRPALGGWRVGVIDAVDELNRSGANALLKTLEEPPPNAVLLLIYHGETPLLATVRSRCRRLKLDRLSEAETRRVLDATGEETGDLALRLAPGRPWEGMRLSTREAAAASKAVSDLLAELPKPRTESVAKTIAAAGGGDTAFAALQAEVLAWAGKRAEQAPAEAALYLDCVRTFAEAREDKMDAAQTAAKLISGLQRALDRR